MTAITTEQFGMALDDFMQRNTDERPFEIINGVVAYMSPHASEHGLIVRGLFIALYQFLADDPNWEVFQEQAFAQITWGTPNWVKGALEPDIMVLSKVAWSAAKAATPDWKKWPVTIVPTLVIEVVSPSDLYTEIIEKISVYQALGVAIVWLVDSRHQTVSVYHQGTLQPEVLSSTQVLTAADVLPNFALAVKKLFDL